MSVSTDKCGGCGTVVRRDDSPLAPPDLKPRRMVFTESGAPLLTVNLCDVCFADAQDASREQVARVARREAALEEPEEARLPDERESEHQAVIEGTTHTQEHT